MSPRRAAAAPAPTPRQARSLIDFARERRVAEQRATCPVCALPDDARAQIRAGAGKHPRREIREWLIAEYATDVAESAFQSHTAGHHE